MAVPDATETQAAEDVSEHVLCVRAGPGANCSSIGSVVEMLFLSAAAGTAILAVITAALSAKTSDSPSEKSPDPSPDSHRENGGN